MCKSANAPPTAPKPPLVSEEELRLADTAFFVVNSRGAVRTGNEGAHRPPEHSAGDIVGQGVFTLDIGVSALETETGTLVSSARRDITDGKKTGATYRGAMEQNRRMEESTRLKSEFIANMSHELRTPLNAVIGFAELMHDEKVGPVSSLHKEYLGDILSSSHHLLQLINDVLDLARIDSGKMEFRPKRSDITKVVGEVRDILRGLAAEKRIKLTIDIDPNLTEITLDPARFKQVLYNYLSNAIKFTPDNGSVTIRVAPSPGDMFLVEVHDTGIGIREEDMHRLFVEFQRLDAGSAENYQGTGLGLALTKRIVEAQLGTVTVTSVVNEGSVFTATFPRFTPMPSPPTIAKKRDGTATAVLRLTVGHEA